MATMEELARRAVAAAPKCECGRIATVRYSDPLVVAQCCGNCCKTLAERAPYSLSGETHSTKPLTEGIHALEVAKAYKIGVPQ